MKKRIVLAGGLIVLAAVGGLAFKLFEPVFTYRSGWAALPVTVPSKDETVDPVWAAAGTNAQAALVAGRAKISAPSLSAALSINGKLVWRGVSGFADVEAGIPATFDTRYRLGSTSKAVTSVAVGTLLDAGKLDLNTPIQTYVPGYPQQKWPITLGQVMSHRAGIRNYGTCLCFPVWEHQNRRHFNTVTDEVSVIANSPLIFQPGADFAYTSLGYNLAGAAVETAAGQPFGAYLKQAIFTPLGMTRTSLNEQGAAGFYDTEPGQYKRAFAVDNSIRWPSGGIVSTPSDMTALGNAMLDDRLLTPGTRLKLVTVPAEGRTRAGRIYAYGWRHGDWMLYDGKLKLDSYTHAGTAVGSTSVFVILPEKGVVLSLMMNKGGENVDDLSVVADQILQAFIAKP
jgi:serine beta-lactamase-like protein LACTB, mitochondrial